MNKFDIKNFKVPNFKIKNIGIWRLQSSKCSVLVRKKKAYDPEFHIWMDEINTSVPINVYTSLKSRFDFCFCPLPPTEKLSRALS